MRFNDDTRLSVADSFQQAAAQPGGWIDALSALAEVTRFHGGQLVGMGGLVTGVSAEWAEEFFASGGGDPFRNPLVGMAAQARVLKTLATDEIITTKARKRNEFSALA